jgi:hypothetical protein
MTTSSSPHSTTHCEKPHDTPDHLVEIGRAAFAWRNIDAELAALTHDSAADDRQPVTVTRAERATLRELTFATRQLKIHIQVTDKALHGQVVPTQEGRIELRRADQPPIVVTIGADGWFTVQPVPVGSFRLHCRTASGVTAVTDWLAV